MKFFICKHCGNLVFVIEDSGVPMICCGEPMDLLVANSTDGAKEKHVPIFTVEGSTVKVTVGSIAHPMTKEHYIQWIFLKTEKGIQLKKLTPESRPEAVFAISPDDKVEQVFEMCNIHGFFCS